MRFDDYQQDLKSGTFEVNRVLDKYFHCGRSAVFEGVSLEAEPEFKNYIARALYNALAMSLHPLQLVVCGSALLGFSPVLEKLGKPFDSRTSDIDIAVVSSELFDRWWRELQASRMDRSSRTKVAEDLFRGFINPVTVASESKIGQDWWKLFRQLDTPFAVGVRGRLYRDFWSMQNYHRSAIYGARDQLLFRRI